MTNGASNVIKLIQLHAPDRPSGVIWVQFDHADVGRKTRHDNRQLYTQGIEPTWTSIKPVTAVFAFGKNRTVQVVSFHLDLLLPKQFIDHKVTQKPEL